MGGERIGWLVELSHHDDRTARLSIVDTRQRGRQAVFTDVPALRRVERWCGLGRPQVLMIPEARQIEVAVVGGEVGRKGDSQVEIDALLRLQRDGEPTEVALPRLLMGDDDGQRLVGGEQASVGGAGEFQVVADGNIAWLFQTELVAHVRCPHLCSKSSEAERTDNGFQNCFHISLLGFYCSANCRGRPPCLPEQEGVASREIYQKFNSKFIKIIYEKFMFNS